MADGSIRVKTKIDNSGVEKDLQELNAQIDKGIGGETANKINRLSAQWEKLSARQSENNAKIREYKAELAELSDLKSLNLASGNKADAIIAGEQTAQMSILQSKLERAEANGQGLSASMEKVGVDASKLSGKMGEVESKTKATASSSKNISQGISGGISKLARYAGALFGIRSVYMGLRRLSAAWLAQDSAGAQQVQANINHIKNSLASALGPVITWITDKVMLLFGYVQAILKALFGWELSVGKTASSMGGVANNAGKTAGGLKDAGKEAKKLQKQMAGFDEMNVLTPEPKDTGSGGAGGGGAGGGAGIGKALMPEIQTPDISGLMNIFDKIKQTWMDIWESDTMQSIVDSITTIWGNSVTMWSSIGSNLWDNILTTFNLMLPDLERGFNNTAEIWRQVLEDIAGFTDEWFPIFTQQINGIVDSVFETFNPLLEFMAQLWADITGVILEIWNEYGPKILNEIGKFISNMIGTFQRIWTKIIDPIITPAIAFMKDMWDRHIKDVLKRIGSFVAEMILEALKFYNEFVQPIVDWVIDWMGPKIEEGFEKMLEVVTIVMDGFFEIVNDILDIVEGVFAGFMTFLEGVFTGDWEMVWQGISDIFESILDGVYKIAFRILKTISKLFGGELDGILYTVLDIMGNVKGVFQGIIDFVAGVFTGDWERAWNGIVSIFENIVSGIANIFKIPLNAMISGINSFIRGVNKVKVPDWVPVVGGNGFTIPTIPKLARGGVVNRATLAEVGEGRHSEAVIPLDKDNTGVQRIADLISSQMQGGSADGEMMKVVVQIDGNTLLETFEKAKRDKEYRTNGRVNYGY